MSSMSKMRANVVSHLLPTWVGVGHVWQARLMRWLLIIIEMLINEQMIYNNHTVTKQWGSNILDFELFGQSMKHCLKIYISCNTLLNWAFTAVRYVRYSHLSILQWTNFYYKLLLLQWTFPSIVQNSKLIAHGFMQHSMPLFLLTILAYSSTKCLCVAVFNL